MLASFWRPAAVLSAGVALFAAGSSARAQSTVNVPPITSWSLVRSGLTPSHLDQSGNDAIVSVDGTKWQERDVCLEADDITFQPGHKYELIFRCRCNDPAGGIRVMVNSLNGSGNADDRTVLLETGVGGFKDPSSWSTYDDTFTVTSAAPMRIRMFMGARQAVYEISNVWIGVAGTAPAVLTAQATGASESASAATGSSAASQFATQSGLSGAWTLQTSGVAQAGVIHTMGGLIIDVDHVGDSISDVAYGTNGSQLSSGASYILHFRARSSEPRVVRASIGSSQQSQADLFSHSVSVGTEWSDYNLPFKNSSGSTSYWAAILLGDHTGTLEVSDARIVNAASMNQTANSQSGQTSVPAGSPAPISQWDLETSGNAVANMFPTAGGATVEVDRSDGTMDHVTLKQDGINLAAQAYDLQFKAKASVSHDVRIVAILDGGGTGQDFHNLGLEENVHLTPTWNGYDIRFTPSQPIDAHARIAFYLGARAGTVDFSDVSLSPAQGGAAQSADATDPQGPALRLAMEPALHP